MDANTDMTNILYGKKVENSNRCKKKIEDSKRLIGWEFLNNLPIAENRQLWTFHVDTRNVCNCKLLYFWDTIGLEMRWLCSE